MMKVSVIGTGSWGTALANVLSENGHDVLMWGKTKATIEEINTHHTNEKYLKDIDLHVKLAASDVLEDVVHHAEIIIIAVPTKAIRSVMQQINQVINNKKTFIHVSKGIEPHTFKRISEMISEEIDIENMEGVAVLSGPSHAEELALKHPTTVAVASENETIRQIAQDIFMNEYFRIYTNDDLVGVEIGGALKNIIALAAGITDGLGYGDNAKAALMTRGLAEITRLGTRMGADPMTFLGLAGIGDLIVTCTSVHSRNWKCGNMLGKGLTLEEALSNMGMVVEGVRTTEAANEMADAFGVEMPITQSLYKVLFEGLDVHEGVQNLMNREKTNE
ncbi:NAD(P)H-dependent glycerol-3-phosphate dehydrogenase [Macrococcus armenti]|uniref:NAD(P)H-dependent glycerol-3-phosphate dehydrogenase n=1 Tax=Macrococcus armenti TaxID=2875764 RepID=UPI001CCF1FDA|nr:NAD(P)H-dependent glycerol-3-phosphate dehydrogenase [Macrococcus armenti]UBH12215.1 NAD(P)H-dependent glycerol-3-phosphate dehydrogenase [Macrococcus armenti]UBH21367.1 NAD(P)H-dependent glycerol-3-phosphate dehydrogenase [Macrococcus armenti]